MFPWLGCVWRHGPEYISSSHVQVQFRKINLKLSFKFWPKKIRKRMIIFRIQFGQVTHIILIILTAGHITIIIWKNIYCNYQTSNQTSKKSDEQISSQKCSLELFSRKANNQISSRSENYGYYGTSLERRLTTDKISSIISNLVAVISGVIFTKNG